MLIKYGILNFYGNGSWTYDAIPTKNTPGNPFIHTPMNPRTKTSARRNVVLQFPIIPLVAIFPNRINDKLAPIKNFGPAVNEISKGNKLRNKGRFLI